MSLYNQISEIPQHNWEQLNLTGDLIWIVKQPAKHKDEELEEAYFDLHDQSAEASGSTEFIEKWKTYMILRMEWRLKLAEGVRTAQNWIDFYSMAIENMMKGNEDSDIVKSRLYVQKLWGQPINAKQVTHLEYLKIRQLVEEEQTMLKSKQSDG